MSISILLCLFAAGSWGGGPAGGYPSIGLDGLSNPGYNAGMVGLTTKKIKHFKFQNGVNKLRNDHSIALSIPVRMSSSPVNGPLW